MSVMGAINASVGHPPDMAKSQVTRLVRSCLSISIISLRDSFKAVSASEGILKRKHAHNGDFRSIIIQTILLNAVCLKTNA